MGMLNPKPEVFCRFACHDEVIQASRDLHDVCTQNYIYRRWFDDFR